MADTSILTDAEARIERASKYLAKMDASIQGQNGNGKLFAAASAMAHGFNLGEAESLRLLLDQFNPRCEPPWPEADIERAVANALTKEHNRPRGHLAGISSKHNKSTASKAPDRNGSPPPPDFAKRMGSYVKNLQRDMRECGYLAEALGIPVKVVENLGCIGVEPGVTMGENRTKIVISKYYWPEEDGTGKITGITYRQLTGKKIALPHSRRGITLPPGWDTLPGPLYIAEGFSDMLALRAGELNGVCRPSKSLNASTAARQIGNALKRSSHREVIILADSDDAKPNGNAAKIAALLLEKFPDYSICWAKLPDKAKDTREWFIDEKLKENTWEERGVLFASGLQKMPPVASSEMDKWPVSESTSDEPFEKTNRPKGANEPIEIYVNCNEFWVNNEAVAALATNPNLFVRGGQLVRVVHDLSKATTWHTDSEGARIVPVTRPILREQLTNGIVWKMYVGDQIETTRPPQSCVNAVFDRGEWPDLRKLKQLVTFPVILPDGSILQAKGYHPETALYFDPQYPVELDVPENPTQEDAKRAAASLIAILADFPFAKPHHASAWLAGLLTPLARHAYRGACPMFLMDANTPGSGKGLLVSLIALIVQGKDIAASTLPDDGAEFRKLVTSLLLRGSPLVLFDDLGGKLGCRELNALLTAPEWSDRILGESREVQLPNLTSWYATGNNVAVQGDTLRRICPIRLDSPHERPEERTDIKNPDLRAWVTQERSRLLSAAFTILRGYIRAGKPNMSLPPWHGFENWSELIRGAISWSGLADPWEGRSAMREGHGDERIQAMTGLLQLWDEIDPTGAGLVCSKIIVKIDGLHADHELAAILAMLVGSKPAAYTSDKRSRDLGYVLRSFDGRVIGDYSLSQAGSGQGGVKRWKVSKHVKTYIVRAIDGGDGGDGGDTSNPPREEKDVLSSCMGTPVEIREAQNIPTIPTIPTMVEVVDGSKMFGEESIAYDKSQLGAIY